MKRAGEVDKYYPPWLRGEIPPWPGRGNTGPWPGTTRRGLRFISDPHGWDETMGGPKERDGQG